MRLVGKLRVVWCGGLGGRLALAIESNQSSLGKKIQNYEGRETGQRAATGTYGENEDKTKGRRNELTPTYVRTSGRRGVGGCSLQRSS